MIKCRLVKINKLSGDEATIYSVILEGEHETLLDKFIRDCSILFKSETQKIVERLISIGNRTGARDYFFKEYEGNLGDGVCALYDMPESHLRLYCIRYGTQIVVVGNGGYKPKTIRALQENDKLKEENYFLRALSKQISERIREKGILFINEGLEFEGNLEFNDTE